MKKAVLLFLLFLTVSFPQNTLYKLNLYCNEYAKRNSLPSVSAGLIENNKIIWTNYTGSADLENNVPAAKNSLYRVASISKSITAVAIMQLVEQGKIKLDGDVRNYLPYISQKKWIFTVRQLLSHTSGIRAYKNDEEFNSKVNFKSVREAILYVAKDTLDYQPGTKYLYSTLAYNLLAEIIEQVSGLSFEDYLQKNIFEPTKMNSTKLDFYNKIIPNRAKGYKKNSLREFENAPIADLTIKFPGGGVLSTVEDLLKFSNGLLQNKLIKKQTLDSMLTETILLNGTKIQYGLGLGFGTDKYGRKYYGHAGGGTGFVSQFMCYPDLNLASVHLINCRDRNLINVAEEIAALYSGDNVVFPKFSLSDTLTKIATTISIDSALIFWTNIEKKKDENFLLSNTEIKDFGYDLLDLNRTKDAIRAFTKLTEADSTFPDGFIGLGEAFNRDGNKGLSLRYLKKAQKLKPNDAQVQLLILQIEPALPSGRKEQK
ncbi:MAG: serine hydrolase [Ignavibacteriaceae bacterium]|jgi:CubicO group peptidase (beta-lactamase class C family)|nr:serine hydrolase [Ignavibacteriaceae bacterium]